MARKRKDNHTQIHIDDLPRKMRDHIHQLGFSSIEHYKKWCRQHNFGCGLNKDSRQRRNELSAGTTIKVSELMANEKKGRNLKDVIPKIYSEELQGENLRNPTAKEIAFAFARSNSREVLERLLLYIGENSDILKDPSYIKGFESIANHSDSWIRPLEAWHVKRHNRDRQFSELLRHLFVTYDVPPFMDRVWFTENETHQNWYKHIGIGQNIRTAPDIPVQLTKKMAHHFLKAPKQYTVDEALRWGQIHALGGDKRLVDAFRGTPLIRNFSNDDFWLNVFRFFIANPMLDVNHVNPIVDFIWNQKFENQQIFVDRGVVEEIDPPQPNFTMRGRTPETLLHQVNKWHQQLGKDTREDNLEWTRSKIGELLLRERSNEKNSTKSWRIRELLSTDELIDEGKAMYHCARSYAKSCYTGKTSIWTLESEDDDNGRRKELTIEVLLGEKLIRQVRGKRNRLPTLKEKSMLSRWAKKEKLEIAEYVKFE